MLLHLSTWAEIEAYLERSKTIVIPIGSNEQHGPTGLLGTDWLCPEIIAHEAQKGADMLVGADLQRRHGPASPGLSRHDLAAALDLHRRDRRLGALAGGCTASSGSISSTATAATSPPSRRRSPSSTPRPASPRRPARLRPEAAQLVGPERASCKLAYSQFPSGHGSHATPSEIAVTQWAYPDAIKAANYAPQIAALRPDPRGAGLPRPPSRRPHGLRPRPGDAGKGRRTGRAGGEGPDRRGRGVRGGGAAGLTAAAGAEARSRNRGGETMKFELLAAAVLASALAGPSLAQGAHGVAVRRPPPPTPRRPRPPPPDVTSPATIRTCRSANGRSRSARGWAAAGPA